MPKILINEVDKTSAGTPGRYGNYAVLITGYKQTAYTEEEINKGLRETQAKNREELCDENGVFEFSSKQAFLDTIGVADVAKKDSTGTNTVERHYGNRMAIELLNLGYSIIYKTIDAVSDMNTEAFWEVFKDKASYDFRFVSHGMLDTCYDSTTYKTLQVRLKEINEAIGKLAKIKEEAAADVAENSQLKILDRCVAHFAELVESGYTGFVDNSGLAYSNFVVAAGINEETFEPLADATTGLPKNKEEIEDRIAALDDTNFTVGVYNEINGLIAKLATYRADSKEAIPGRGDCVALIELDENEYCGSVPSYKPEALIIDGINNMSTITSAEGPYCAMTVPSVYYKMSGQKVKFPGAFHYLACFMNSMISGFAEWYAAAGYTRGVSSYIIDHTSVKLGEIAINALEPRNIEDQAKQPKFACNVIANFRGSYYLWGNRTAAKLNDAKSTESDLTAEHFLNIRQLCSTIKKQLYTSCRRFTFDPNSDTLWFNFVNSVTPTLDAMKADQGIRDYRIVKVATDKKATLEAIIRIIPIEAVEDFVITVSLEDSFGGISVTAEG